MDRFGGIGYVWGEGHVSECYKYIKIDMHIDKRMRGYQFSWNILLCFQSISTDRIQGQTIKCSVEEGNISATSVYSTDSEFTCNHGNINLMNTHGVSKTTVNKGNLIIGRCKNIL